tara:strand:- start:7146 stop:8045 length:900 start_codon:yes stop_codon:yes gene_type:complete
MFRKLMIDILLLGSIIIYGQDKTPIASFPLDSHIFYRNKIDSIVQIYEETKEIKTLDSLANFSYAYKDWETAINYSKKAIDLKPTAKRYFLLGGAAGFRALEVPMFSSIKYINIMKPAFEQALSLEPLNLKYLRAQVDVLLALPVLLGGSIYKAKEIINKIKSLNLIEGLLAEGSMYEIGKDLYHAKKVYKKLFDFIDQNYSPCSVDFINDIRRDLAYDLGRIAADFDLNTIWGLCALKYFAETHQDKDTVPKGWVYYQSARLAKKSKNIKQMDYFIEKARLYLNRSPDLKPLLKELKL